MHTCSTLSLAKNNPCPCIFFFTVSKGKLDNLADNPAIPPQKVGMIPKESRYALFC
jgi:hypothetical protein